MVTDSTGRPRLCLVAPAYNEEGKINKVVTKVVEAAVDLPVDVTLVVVDDCSTDNTAQEAREAGAVVLSHPDNTGVGGALRTGFHYAREHDFEFAGLLSGDDQHNPDELDRFLPPLLEGGADLVQGSRWRPGGRVLNIPSYRAFLTRFYSVFFWLATGVWCSDGTNGFRVFRTAMLDDPRIDLEQTWLNTYELEPYLLYKAYTCGFRVVEVPITIRYHSEGYTKMRPVLDWWSLLRPLLFLRLGLRQ